LESNVPFQHKYGYIRDDIKQQYVLHMSPQYGELLHTSGWDRSGSLGHPCKFQRIASRQRYCTASSSGCQPNFAAL